MAISAESQRDQLFQDGSALRVQVVEALREAYQIKLGPKEIIFRKSIISTEKKSQDLLAGFLAYDDRVSAFIQMLGTTRQVETAGGLEEISLNTQLQFAMYASQLSTHREGIRSAMHDLNDVLSSRRTGANTLTALFVSLASLFVALFLGTITVMSR
jgi:hypothetical protein